MVAKKELLVNTAINKTLQEVILKYLSFDIHVSLVPAVPLVENYPKK
jgi:hypothetical protein